MSHIPIKQEPRGSGEYFAPEAQSLPDQMAPQTHHNFERPVKQELKPDHGENFVPGSESAPDHMAPQPLDHFKRGYKERADLRDREITELANDFDLPPTQLQPPPAVATKPSPPVTEMHQPRPTQQRNFEPHENYRGTGGFDANKLVDVLCRPGCNLSMTLDRAKEEFLTTFQSGKALTAILSNLARRRKMGIALSVWQWMDERHIDKNVYHYNSLISVCEKMKDNQRALRLLEEMERRGIQKNEVTFSSAISACEKAGQWRVALNLLDRMTREGVGRTAIAYNAAISACEKGLVPHKALELFEQMKSEGVTPTVITYSALISAAEKGQQWKLALEVLEAMKASGHGANVIAYSAAISALSKGQMWEKALELFREIESSGNTPSIVTYNATMTALEKGLQWERALDLFDEMKAKRLPITVVSYGSAISACEKGLQYRQCLEYLDEMTELGIKKNVIIFGAAMSCMEKCCRADIAFQLMDRMKMEGVAPNVHIFNSAISACARCNLWKKGLELFEAMEDVGVVRDVVSFNAVLDAVSSQVELGRRLFELGIEKGFYARVSRLGTQWLELDLHFLSLGGGEIALGWWFEVCLVPYLVNTSHLAEVKSIDIVTGYGKTRMRGIRHGDDGMRKRVRAMLNFMNIREIEQPNKGRIHIDKAALIQEVQKNGGKIILDHEGYNRFKEENTTANHVPDVPQTVRRRYSGPLPTPEMSTDRRSYGTKRDGYDRRGAYENPHHQNSRNVRRNIDRNTDHAAHRALPAGNYSDRYDGLSDQCDNYNHGSSLYSGRGSHGNNAGYEGQPNHGSNQKQPYGGNFSGRAGHESGSSEYYNKNSKNMRDGSNDRIKHDDSRFGAGPASQKSEFEQGSNASKYPGGNGWASSVNNDLPRQPGPNQDVALRRTTYYPSGGRPEAQSSHDSFSQSRHSTREHMAQNQENRHGHYDATSQQGVHRHSYQHSNQRNHYEGSESNRSNLHTSDNYDISDTVNTDDHGHDIRPKGNYARGERRPGSGYHGNDQRRNQFNVSDRNEGRQFNNHLGDSYETRNNEQSYGARRSNQTTRDVERHYSEGTASSFTPRDDSQYYGSQRSHNATNNVNFNSREIGEYQSQDRSDDGDRRSNHSGHEERRYSNFNGERHGWTAGEKRSVDGGERPAAKRRGYDIDPSRSSFSSTRGY